MGDLIEIIFEDVRKPMIHGLVSDLISLAPNPVDLRIDGIDCADTSFDARIIDGIKDHAFLRLGTMCVPGYGEVEHVSMQLLQTDEVDVELHIDLDDVTYPGRLKDALFQLANEVAMRHKIASYFGGLEPATDEETRFFTGTTRGPL